MYVSFGFLLYIDREMRPVLRMRGALVSTPIRYDNKKATIKKIKIKYRVIRQIQ